MNQFDIVHAMFLPVKTDDLKPGVANFIGEHAYWTASWIIESGPYKGEWAMVPDIGFRAPLAWVPFSDLSP